MGPNAVNQSHVFFEPKARPKKARAGAAAGAVDQRRTPSVPENYLVDPLFLWLFEKAGISPGIYRPRTLDRRLDACLRRLKVGSGAAAQALLETHPELIPEILDAVLIGVSSFFRDPDVFENLRTEVDRASGGRRGRFRVLSAGCAEGQELYSVAILLDELGVLDSSELLGVDCRPAAVERARRGLFIPAQLAGVNTVRKARYFSLEGSGFSVREFLRCRTSWETDDLLRDSDNSRFDLICCRNVAIFLTPGGAATVWSRLCEQLVSGGVLVTGSAEKPSAQLPLNRIGPCIYRKY
jgi:chemotaxis methyl-accepting protein methylase